MLRAYRLNERIVDREALEVSDSTNSQRLLTNNDNEAVQAKPDRGGR